MLKKPFVIKLNKHLSYVYNETLHLIIAVEQKRFIKNNKTVTIDIFNRRSLVEVPCNGTDGSVVAL